MNILLTNDDGFESDGIRQFAQLLSEKHNVVLIAPENNRSAVSHSLSIFKNIVVKKISGGKFDVYSVSGTVAADLCGIWDNEISVAEEDGDPRISNL